MILLRQSLFSKKEDKKGKDAVVYGASGAGVALGTGAALGAVKVGDKLTHRYGGKIDDILNKNAHKHLDLGIPFSKKDQSKLTRLSKKQHKWMPSLDTKSYPHGKNIKRLRGAGIGLATASALAAGGYALSKKKGKKDDNK